MCSWASIPNFVSAASSTACLRPPSIGSTCPSVMGSNVALLSSECCLSRRREMTHQAMHAFGAIPFERANDFHSLFADSGRRVSYLDTVSSAPSIHVEQTGVETQGARGGSAGAVLPPRGLF